MNQLAGGQGGRGWVPIPGRAVPEVPGWRTPRGMESQLYSEGTSQLECVTGFCPGLLIIFFGTVQVPGRQRLL